MLRPPRCTAPSWRSRSIGSCSRSSVRPGIWSRDRRGRSCAGGWRTRPAARRSSPSGEARTRSSATSSPWSDWACRGRRVEPTLRGGAAADGASQFFRYAIDRRYLPVLLPFLLRPSRDGVTLTDDGLFVATFGLVKIETPRANVTGAHITEDYRWWTAVGVRMSMADDGLTFGTNNKRGVCVHFGDRV